MIMKFYWTGHGWIFGKYNPETEEFTLPSGHIIPVENGMVYFVDGWYKLVDGNL
jgi:hypothetical protein